MRSYPACQIVGLVSGRTPAEIPDSEHVRMHVYM